MADDARIGPAFDSNTLIRPTQRKLVGCWMERAGLPTLILPQVWRELTATPTGLSATRHVLAWRRMQDTPSAPFRWATLNAEQAQSALELRRHFTQACFPRALPDEIENNSDAIIISEAIALDTDVLVTGDIRSIDHYEVNATIAQALGRNSHFVVTLDDALLQAYSGGELGEELLVTALASIAPESAWTVDAAFADLQTLHRALIGANMPRTACRLLNRWECSLDLESTVERALAQAHQSRALHHERLRTEWLRTAEGSPQDGRGQ